MSQKRPAPAAAPDGLPPAKRGKFATRACPRCLQHRSTLCEEPTGECLSLETMRLELHHIDAWADAFDAWKGLGAPLLAGYESMTRAGKCFDDFGAGHQRVPHHPDFLRMVRYVLRARFPAPPTPTMSQIMTRYRGTALGSPIGLLLTGLLFDEQRQADFLALAAEFHDPWTLLPLCAWAITARQHPARKQMDMTRSAMANLVALILSQGSAVAREFHYDSARYMFEFRGGAVQVWLPHLALFWFGVEMPHFAEQRSNVAAFLTMLAEEEEDSEVVKE